MAHRLQPRRIGLSGNCHLLLEPDPNTPQRYLVRFCGLDRDPAARAATEHTRVRQMMASLRGQAPYPYPLPRRIVIGWLDSEGWHRGRSGYAEDLAAMPKVRQTLDELQGDLLLRVALIAAREVR